MFLIFLFIATEVTVLIFKLLLSSFGKVFLIQGLRWAIFV